MPREPAYVDKRSQDGEAQATSERANGTMPFANVRRRGMVSPERVGGLERSSPQVENLRPLGGGDPQVENLRPLFGAD